MWKLLPTILLLLIVCYTDVQAETTSVTTVTCVDTVVPVVTENSPIEGDTTTTTTTTTNCTTTVVTTVTTPESTTTTTTVAENLTSSGDILENSDFKHASNNNYGADGWTITDNPGYHNTAGSTGGDSTGGVVASGHNTNISQTVTSVKSETGMSEAELQHGFRSTLSAKLWFWNSHTNKITLKQTITDNDGNTTTQTRILTDTGCGYTNCGVWEDFDDTYIQGSNSATDFSIKAEVNNVKVTGSTSGHWGPDIDSIELNVQHNEITTTTETVAATSSSSTASTIETTIAEVIEVEYCWQKTPSTCAGDQPGVDDIEEDIIEAVNETVIEEVVEEVTVINVTNLDVEELVVVNVTMDEAVDMELLSDPEQTFEEAFTNIIEEAGMEEEFEAALEDEGLTEEEFFNEVEDVMEEEMGTPDVEPEIETESEVETETEPEITTEPTIEDEEVMNTSGSEETMEAEVEEETEVETETETEVETEEEIETEEEVETETEVEEPSETGDAEVEEGDDVEVDEVEVEAQVEEIQASIERVIARIEANLTRIDLKLKATSFVLAKAMQDQQPDMTEYTTQSFYDPNQLPDNRDWYAEDTILDAYGRSIYQDVDLGEYTVNDQLARHEEEINTVNNNISRLEAELEELENELNE